MLPIVNHSPSQSGSLSRRYPYIGTNLRTHIIATSLFYGVEKLRHKQGWLLTLGITMLALGIVLFLLPAATIGSVLAVGWNGRRP